MTVPHEMSQASPALFFDTMNAYQRTAALKSAIELDLFTRVAEGADSVGAIAEGCGAAERGIRILCDFLVVVGFLQKQESRYSLTPDSTVFLNRHSPAYMGTAVQFLGSPMLTGGFEQLTAAVRHGGTVIEANGLMAPEHPVWVEFARGMPPLIALPAELIAGLLGAEREETWRVLDIAAGHGLFGVTLARRNAKAQVVAVDWPNVLAVAQETARQAGVGDRYSVIPGDALEVDYGQGYDVALVTNILHGFDIPSCEKLLCKVHAALKPAGRAVALEFVPDEQRTSPPIAASFSLMMLANTPGGEAYTAAEMESMFRSAGFSSVEFQALPGTLQHVMIGRK